MVAMNLNLFFLRIMKEHCIFLESSFVSKDQELASQAANMKEGFEDLLMQATTLADGIVSPKAIKSGQFVTPYTAQAERLTCHFTGIPINSGITVREKALSPGDGAPLLSSTDAKIKVLNDSSGRLTQKLRDFKKDLLANVLDCRLFTVNFPLELLHMVQEADHYLTLLDALDGNNNIMQTNKLMEQEAFWNRNMAEHSRFAAGKLDPTEEGPIEKSRKAAEEFDRLESKAKSAGIDADSAPLVTKESLASSKHLQEFQTEAIKGVMDCKIQSIILPLVVDHHIRETAYYMWLLEMGLKAQP